MLSRHSRREQRAAFVSWLALVKSEQQQKRQENLSYMITELSFKQRIFLSLKHACLKSKVERTVEKFELWKDRCQKYRESKFFKSKKLMIERLQGVRTERLLKTCFDAIKYCNVLYRFEETSKRLG